MAVIPMGLMGLGKAARPRVWRPRTHTLLVALVSLVYAALFLFSLVTLLAPPRLFIVLNVSQSGQARIAWVQSGSTLWDEGVRPGSVVLTLDGHRPTPRDAGVWMGQRLVLRQTGGNVITVDAARWQGSNTWPLLLLSPAFFLLGTLIVLRASPPHVGRAAYALFAGAACALALAPAADSDNPLASLVEFGLVALFGALFVIFFLAYPVPRGTPRRYAALLAPPLAAIVLDLAAQGWPALYEAASLLRLAILLLYLLLGVALVVHAFATVREREARRGLTIIAVGTALGILPFVALYLLPTLLRRPALMAPEHAILALALLGACFAYAILRHNALNVRLFQRWLVHGALWVALLTPFTLAAVARYWLLDAMPEPARSITLAVALAVVAGLTFGVLRPYLQCLLDRVIFKDSYDYRASLQQLSRDLSLAENLDALGTALPATLSRLMNLDFALLLVRDAETVRVCGATDAYQESMLLVLADAARDVRDAPRVVSLAFGYLTVLLAPLHTRDVVVGHLCLGPKASGEPFRAEDQALLATLGGHLAAIVRNAQLAEDLRAKVTTLDALNERLQRTQEEERARLATDLHDEPLQTALTLQQQIARDGHCRASVGHLALAQALTSQLRALCTAMRPAALDHLGLHAALDQLVRERAARAGVPIVLDADPEIMELDLAPEARLVLYRAAQEALSNCLRHAHARAVRVSLRRHEDGIRLLVADDGAGFAVPARFDDLARNGHLGLVGLHERVQREGGRLRVTSAPREGTVVQVDLPIAPCEVAPL